MQRSYQAKCAFPSTENIESYSILKAKYQKRLCERKAEILKELCSNNCNGDLFGALKRITWTSAGHCPPPLMKIDGSHSLDPLLTLKAFSSSFFPITSPNSQFPHNFQSEVLDKVAEPTASFEPISRAEVLISFVYLKPNQSPGTDGCLTE